MKTYIEQFMAARMISTPQVVIRTHDALATVKAIASAFGPKEESTPLISWDSINGLKGYNDKGCAAIAAMLQPSGTEAAETVSLPVALGVLAAASADVVAFIHNAHLAWDEDKRIIQGIANLRDDYKASGNMLVLLEGVGDDLPSEIGQDVLVLEVPLPTRSEIEDIVKNAFAYAGQEKKFSACKKGPDAETLRRATDASIGLSPFPIDQAVAFCLDGVTGVLDVDALWGRKREIVTQNPGLTYHATVETLKNMSGCDAWLQAGHRLMAGPKQPTVIVRMDEIQRQFAGNETDSSGTKGNLMGEFLNWINDNHVTCTLNLGVSGTSKSWSPYCLAGEYGKPVLNYDISAMEHEHVGKSARHMRNANRCLNAIGDGHIWLIATANKLDGLPPELISRFNLGGVWFFDMPTDEEKAGIVKIKLAAYGLDANSELPAMVGWTGRDIDNCAAKAQAFACSYMEASQYIVPLHESHHEVIEGIRSAASGRFLSASKGGIYRYEPSPIKHEPTTKIVEGRKFRTE